MNRWILALRGFQYHWRSHLGVFLGLVLGSAVLTGALMVGDSVDHTLRTTALNRLGEIDYALQHPGRFFRDQLADEVQAVSGHPSEPAFYIRGMASKPGSDLRSNRVSVYGVQPGFWDFGTESGGPDPPGADEVILNRELADALEAEPGSAVLLRIENPSSLSRDAPLTTLEDTASVLRLTVAAVADNGRMGRFDLRANQVAPHNAFVSLAAMQEAAGQAGRANMILTRVGEKGEQGAYAVQGALQESFTLDDAQLQLGAIGGGLAELRTDRIFLDAFIPGAISSALRGGGDSYRLTGILTYLVNELRAGDAMTPYSMVSAIGELEENDPLYSETAGLGGDGIVLNQWLADDLGAKPGDTLEMRYFVLGPMRGLVETSREFTVRSIVPMDHPMCDPGLMPDFPGISGKANCREWDPGFAIDLDKVRTKDEEYWDEYQGTPKAFVSLEAGREMWANRFGNLTAIRFSAADGGAVDTGALEEAILANLNPETFGFSFQPVREQALASVDQALDFGALFIGFSLFLIAAALILVGLLFVFGLERRSEEAGILLASGYTPKSLRRYYGLEGFLLACAGGLVGGACAAGYTWLMLLGLNTVWSGAASGVEFQFAFSPTTFIVGVAAAIAAGSLALWRAAGKMTRAGVRELLTNTRDETAVAGGLLADPSNRGLWIGLVSLAGALALLGMGWAGDASSAAGQFFGAGALLLIAGIGFAHALFSRLGRWSENKPLTLDALGIRNNARRRGRAAAVTALLACGGFLVVAVGANRHDASTNVRDRDSGSGGFAFWGETTLPLLHDLNTEEGCNEFGLTREDLHGADFVPLRLREGDEASCLNLNRAQKPQVLGVDPQALAGRDAFRFAGAVDNEEGAEGWEVLDLDLGPDVVPAVADQNSILWALGKSVGDTLEYTDDNGESFEILLAGAVSRSILQGALVISEKNFIQRFPSAGGYQVLLVDAPWAKREEIGVTLTNALRDLGLSMVPTEDRLAAFNAVENTYLSIFQLLGGLGLILGSLGVGVLVLRNVLERRGELALLRASGFSRGAVMRLILGEHWLLLGLGLGCGILSGLLAAAPALAGMGSRFPVVSMSITLAAMLASGFLWVWLAARIAIRGELLDALRNE